MQYPYFINQIPGIEKASFLEIGLGFGHNHKRTRCLSKQSVDPQKKDATHRMTSDQFFQSCKESYDIIVIDGDHHVQSVFNDWNHAVDHLNPGGVILIHDFYPSKESWVHGDSDGSWCGDGYKILFSMVLLGFHLRVFLPDFGLTAIFERRSIHPSQIKWDLDYKEFWERMLVVKPYICLDEIGFSRFLIDNFSANLPGFHEI